jgi:hypothetical protein
MKFFLALLIPLFLICSCTPVVTATAAYAATSTTIVAAATSTLPANSERDIDDLSFQSGNITLVGILQLPAGEGPFPAVIWVHGSGPSTREEGHIVSRFLLAAGIAVFRYDKRGVGDSGGHYGEVMSKTQVPILAGDAAAAVEFMAARPEIDAAHIGLFGASQAGWIIPVAANLSSHVSFIAFKSGPTVPVGAESFFSNMSPNQEGWLSDKQIDDFSQRLAAVEWSGFDPRPSIEALQIPGLWVFGARDASIPVRESATILEEIKTILSKDFKIFIYPTANHFLFHEGDGEESWMKDVVVPWILEKINQ